MKRSIWRVAVLIITGLMLAGLYAGYWQIIRAHELTSNSQINWYRKVEAENRNLRGRFLDRHGEPLVWSRMIGDTQVREYALPSLAHVTGFHTIRFGNSNLEDRFSSYLSAAVGFSPEHTLRSRLLGQPLVGADVSLTIDSEVQRAADVALGDHRGAIVALNPRTGEILALVSHPSFDPNILESEWEAISQDEGHPLLNRATQGIYVAGSTFKTVTLAAALDLGLINIDDVLDCPQELDVEGFTIVSLNHPPEQSRFDVSHTYAYSCNTTFATLGIRLGSHRLAEYARRFGFEQEVPIEIVSQASKISSDPEFLMNPAALASTAFGQGELQVTPLQMALVAAAIGNGGTIQQPYLVSRVVSAEGAVLYQTASRPWLRAVSPETAAQVTKAMRVAVTDGWSRHAAIPGIAVAGKTGTGEVGGGLEPHAWFIGFAPAEDPQVAVAVIVENGGSGPEVAAPLAGRVMAAALSSRGE